MSGLFDSINLTTLTSNLTTDQRLIQNFIPSYVQEGSWQLWDESESCPAGFTCAVIGESSLGAFSCDELARIAEQEFGFGNVLAGTWCPEGKQEVYNCPVGSYCPNTTTSIPCPSGTFCPYKTLDTTFIGGGVKCERCLEGAETMSLSRTEIKVIQIVVFLLLLIMLVTLVLKRKHDSYRERLKKKFSISSSRRRNGITSIKQNADKYKRLQPKLEVIAQRLGKIQSADIAPQDSAVSPRSLQLSERNSVLFINKNGDIIFHADKFFAILDKNSDGELSFEEINAVLCLEEGQLRAFIAVMNKLSDGKEPIENGMVSKSTFTKCFLDALSNASQLQPTPEEAAEIFDAIAEEVGTTNSGEIEYAQLYNSYLSSFLNDQQIYGIITLFKKQADRDTIGSSSRRLLSAGIMTANNHTFHGGKVVSKHDFVEYYPKFLSEVTHPNFMNMRATLSSIRGFDVPPEKVGGLDVTFENLSLTVKVGKNEKMVVNQVSGRLRSNTMTAVMGGSGSGKSSLLNALCGRAFYGKTTGNVFINGNESKIENHKSSIGFVPQEDIVFADLTVRENLIYAGRFYLPKGTSKSDIEELADATMASLGLSRIANSLVGDATRRGVSGGEKKRVNIGVELMKQPRILFLDEPTSGLDSRSAFVVMESLQRLCKQGMTVASVIHQPRTDIYAMFDSLFLLGVGGCTVYHGPAMECRHYFESLGHHLKQGDSQADWFLDISSGDVDAGDLEENGDAQLIGQSFQSSESQATTERESLVRGNNVNETNGIIKAQQNREHLYSQWIKHFETLDDSKKKMYYLPPTAYDLPAPVVSVPGWIQLLIQLQRNCLLSWRNRVSRMVDFGIVIVAVFAITLLGGVDPSAYSYDPTKLLWISFISSESDASSFLQPQIFTYAFRGINALSNYTMMVGLILSVLVGLNSVKILTNNKLEFFREAQSGLNVTSFLVAASITSTLEQGVVAVVGALVAYLVITPSSTFLVYLAYFLVNTWLSVGWAHLLALIVPIHSVSTVVAFFNAALGLLFCGKITPGVYSDIYSNPALAVFSGIFSPLYFFVEGLCVSEAKCFPAQSGYTVASNAYNFPDFEESYSYWYELTYMAHTDMESALKQDCSGWYWWIPAAITVGLLVRLVSCIAINFADRSKQGKKSVWTEMTLKKSFFGVAVAVAFVGLLALSCWLILRQGPTTANFEEYGD